MDVERIARAIDPEAWSGTNRYPEGAGWVENRRLRSEVAAARVQEELREPLREVERLAEQIMFPEDAETVRAALGVAEQPKGSKTNG